VQKDRNKKKQAYGELSAVWQELLGGQTDPANPAGLEEDESATAIPTLESDPWSTLVHAKGVEMVDQKW